MDKGQAHVAVILIITLAAIVGGVLVVVFVLNDQSATPTSSTDPWNSGATIPGGTPGNIPTIPTTPTIPSIPTTGGSSGTMDWLLEETPNVISESSMLADFVNSKMTTESEAYANYPPVECDLGSTPFSLNGASQAIGLRTCNGDDEIVDLGIMDIYDVWKLDASTFNWVSNPTATVGHVYVIKARDGSQHRIEVISINGEEVTISWVSGI